MGSGGLPSPDSPLAGGRAKQPPVAHPLLQEKQLGDESLRPLFMPLSP